MQCKLGKNYFRCFAKAVFGFILGWVFFQSHSAHSVISITPKSGGTLGGTITANTAQGSINYYYFVTKNGSPDISTFTQGFLKSTPIDIAYGSSTDPSPLNSVFEFDLGTTSTYVSTANQVPTVVVQAVGPTTGSSPRPAPIASVNGVACNNQICQAYNQNGTIQVVNGIPVSPAPFYAAKLQGLPIRIGVYLKDICSDYLAGGITLSACGSDGNVNTPGLAASPSTVVFPLKFVIQYASDGVNPPSGQVIDSTPNPVNLTLQSSLSSATCPSQSTFNNTVRPDDGRVGIDTSIFNYSASNGRAPALYFYVVAKEQPASSGAVQPVINSNFSSSNDIVSKSGFGGSVQALGFKNSTASETYNYLLSFLIQDQTGAYITPTPSGSATQCEYGPIQTANVSGFLEKNGCFIATAAYGDENSPAVNLLRNFRDQVLLHTSLGRSFVNWYYDWSPEYAQKLKSHALLRLPVLYGLAYAQGLAWLSLFPIYFLIMGGFSLLLAFSWMKRVQK